MIPVKKRIIVSVSNDIATDQRVRKQCGELSRAGFEVVLLGRKLPESLGVEREYQVIRAKLPFNKGALFYASLNVWLFFKLLFSKVDALWANDLDTLPANALVAGIKRRPLVYDAHEFFTEVPEIQDRPWVKKTWKWLESRFIGKADLVITVNNSIAELLKKTYRLSEVMVVRNVPDNSGEFPKSSREDLGLPGAKTILIMQGSGINVDRGAEELVEAMRFVPDAVLIFVGGGDAIPNLKKEVKKKHLEDKVAFYPKMPYAEMMKYTAAADLGITLDKDTNVNYRYSLPNKIFDYVRAGIPIIASDLPEVSKFVRENEVGFIVKGHDPRIIGESIKSALENQLKLAGYKENAEKLRGELNWSTEFEQVRELLIKLVC